MSKNKYQSKQYLDQLMLPPGSDASKPTRGHIIIALTAIRLTSSQNNSHLVGRFKMWGQTINRYVELGQQITYEIKCRNTMFVQYLSDMIALNFQLVDKRNQQLFGAASISLLTHLNKNISFPSDPALLPIDSVYQVTKNPSKIVKAEVGLKIQTIFSDVRQMPTFAEARQEYPMTDVKLTSVESLIGQRPQIAHYSPMKIEEQPIFHQPARPQIKQPQYIPKSKPTLPIIKPSLPIIEVRSPRIRPGQLDAQLLRLQLEAQSLLSAANQPVDYPRTLTVEVVKVVCPKWQDITLQISYPKQIIQGIYGNEHISTTIMSKNKSDFPTNLKFAIENWQDMLQKTVSFHITNNKYQHLTISTDFTVKNILQSKQLQLTKNNKNVGYVDIRTQLSRTNKKETQQEIRPKTTTSLSAPPTSSNNLISISIKKCTFFDSRHPQFLYKVTFKLMKQNYETQSAMLNWNYTLISPLSVVPEQMLCLELWRTGDKPMLEGLSKIRLDGLATLIKQGINPVNIGAVVLKDGNVPLSNIQSQRQLGFLEVRITVGNVRQMQWQQQRKQEHREKPQRQQRPYIREQSNPPSSSNRVETQRRLQTKQTDSKAIEVDEADIINIQDINIAQTLTRFFQMLSQMPAKTTLFIKNIGESQTMDRDKFRKILTTSLGQQQQQLILVLAFFLSDQQPNSPINISEFMKCFSSYANFIEILMEERSALLQRALSDLQKHCTLDIIQQKLSKYSQFGLISRQKFQDVMQQYTQQRLATLLANSLSQTDTIDITSFINDLKNVKFGRKPQHINVKTSTFQQLIKQSVQDVLSTQDISINQLLQNVTHKDMTAKNVAQLLQNIKIEISYWEGLLLLETIKSTYRQDLSAPNGIISNETLIAWIQGVVDSNTAANKSLQAHKLNKTISKSSFQQSKARSKKDSQNADDIHQIADLLKFKDRYDYTQSISKSKQLNIIAQNQSKYSNVLPAQSNVRASKKQSIDPDLVEIRRPDPIIRFLRCQVIEVKSEAQGSTIICLELSNSYQMLLSLKDGTPTFYSSNIIYQQIDLSDMVRYAKTGIRGITVSMNQDGRNICKGLIPLEDIFQLDRQNQTSVKKVCALYPRSSNKIVLNMSLVRKKKEPTTLQKIKIYFRVIRATKKSGQAVDGTMTVAIDKQKQHQNIQIYEQYVIRPSENLYSSKLTMFFNNHYWASMTLESLITCDDYRAQIPLVDDSSAYYGKLQLILSRNPITVKNTQNEDMKIMKLRLFIFVENIICLRPKKKKMDVYWSVYIRGKEVSRSTTIEIDINGIIHCQDTTNICLNCQLTSSQPVFQLRMMGAISNQTYAISRLAINPTIDTDNINFSTSAYCIAQNKDKYQMRFELTLVSVLVDDSVRLDNLIRIFRKHSRRAIRKMLGNDDLNEKNIKEILHDRNNLTYSEIAYLSQAISIDNLKNAFKMDNLLSRNECLQLLAQFEFCDPDATGFVSRQQLDRILQIFNMKQSKEQFLVDMLTKNRINVDYVRYLQYEMEPSHVDSSFKEINSEIDRLHETINRRLTRN